MKFQAAVSRGALQWYAGLSSGITAFLLGQSSVLEVSRPQTNPTTVR